MLQLLRRPPLLAFMLAGAMGLNACSAQDSDATRSNAEGNSSNFEANLADVTARKNLVELVTGNENFSTLASLLKAADLVSVVENGEFTVLAPTDEAFAKLPQAVVDYLLSNKEALRDVLLYHVVAGSAKAETVLASDTLTAANGKALDVNLREGKPFVNDSGIIATDILASNGVVHVIDSVLVPPGFEIPATPALPNLVDLVIEGEQFTTLEALLIQADLVDAVKNGEFTVLAPTDAAFAKLPKAVVDYLLSNKEALRDVLLYHVVTGTAKAEVVLASETLTAANGDSLDVNLRDGKPYINDSAIVATDILASNGVVHVIDSVLVPPGFEIPSTPALPNLVDLVVQGEQFATLEALLIQADLVDTIKNGEFTVFAPTDAAFAKLPKAVVDYLLSNQAALQQVLLYHVVAGTNPAEKVLQSPSLTSAAGSLLNISLRQGKPYINDSQIVTTDVFASNGVVHVIDTVLVPPGFILPQVKPNIIEAVKANPNFSILGDLLARTGLTEVIAKGNFTVFAPTNAAFHAFFRSRGVKSLDELDAKSLKTLTSILTYHAVPGRLDAKALKSSRFLTTANGQKLKIARFGSHFFVNGICLPVPGLDLANGIVYPIERVLLPKAH